MELFNTNLLWLAFQWFNVNALIQEESLYKKYT